MKFNFDPRGVETAYQLRLIKRLFQSLESQLGEMQARTVEELRNEFPIDCQDAYDEMRSIVGGQENHHETEVQALRSAELVRLYMLLEQELKSFCKAIKTGKGQRRDLGDFKKGSLIKKAQDLLCDHAQLISRADPIWTELDDFRIVRVHLVHSSEDNSNQRALEEFQKLVVRRAELKLWDGYELALERFTCDHFHNVIEGLFKMLFDSVGWKAYRETGPIIVDEAD